MNPDIAKAFLHYSIPSFLYLVGLAIPVFILLFNPLAILIGVSLIRHFYLEESINGFHETGIAIFCIFLPYFGIIYPVIYYLKNGDLN